MTARKLTVAEVREFCQSLDISFRKVVGEIYRIAPQPITPGANNEASAYYSGDLDDIVNTAYELAGRR